MVTNPIKDKIHTLIDQIQDESVLAAYTTLLEKEIERENNNTDFWNELPDDIKSDLEISLEDSAKNEYKKKAADYITQLKK